MRCYVHSYCKLAVGLLAATGVVGLMARTILARSNPPGPAASTQDEPIKRSVLFRGDLEDAPGKEIVVFVADLAPGAVGSKHYHPGPEFARVRQSQPSDYLKAAVAILPKQVEMIENPLSALSDDELEQLERYLKVIRDAGESPIRVISPKDGK
jgi:hypothetical protein